MDSTNQWHIEVTEQDANPVAILADESGLSHQTIKQAMQKGCVWHSRGKHTQRLRRSKKKLQRGDVVHCYYNPRVLATEVEPALLVDDQGDFSVWFKPYGMVCQGSKWGDHTTINRFAEQYLQPQRPAFIVHRLDKATTGLVVVAHTKAAARQLSSAFEQRLTEKTYQAIVSRAWSFKQPQISVTEPIDEKNATSHVTLIANDRVANRALVSVDIETGRKHQIRKHLASLGIPIVGDRLYGQQQFEIPDTAVQQRCDLQLRAVRLQFPFDGRNHHYQLTKQQCLHLS
ncbi:RluA family pseudouridine synthase [Thalassotalea ponticola]|uniref:RluA family pseudouridine synthase n=1 Tax=Thalassotalea ponticola TaxID=1523392 RepID=UPI0025B5C14E|nr:RluA family pseudouridine synthase [Thalassotalea ponticola]MDN3653943.1 RluA family pseudouridine synthase [Thalassotalea ponticola]